MQKSLFFLAAAAAMFLPLAHAEAAIGPLDVAQFRTVTKTSNEILLAHAQPFRHCHNVHHRVYCHKSGRLPMNWPPFSNTKKNDKQAAVTGCRKPRANIEKSQ